MRLPIQWRQQSWLSVMPGTPFDKLRVAADKLRVAADKLRVAAIKLRVAAIPLARCGRGWDEGASGARHDERTAVRANGGAVSGSGDSGVSFDDAPE